MKVILSIIIVILLFSCNKKNENVTKALQMDGIKNNANTIINQEIVKDIPGEENKRYFIHEVWQCNLPLSSSEAIELGYNIEQAEKNDPDDRENWTYFGRSGYDFEITCLNEKNEIVYWVNDKKSTITWFESIDPDLMFLNYKFIGKNMDQIKMDMRIGIIEERENVINYDNKDFQYNLYFENNVCIKIEYLIHI
ncbi:MAG: hypothetical protein LBG95_04350 [Treponema sp.]|nr:hypothetical protein [Treponema sp.]